MTKTKRAVWGWAMYDWANSAFATTVIAGFFPIFFKQYWSFGTDVNTSTALLGIANSISSLIVALLAPILGAIADGGSLRKRLLILFAYLGVLMTASLFMVGKGNWAGAIFIYTLGNIGFAGANVFYDSLLPSVAGKENIDYVSGLGYGLGYLGGGLLFFFNVWMTMSPATFGLPDAGYAVRISFVTVAAWWGLFTIFTILWVPEAKTHAPKEGMRKIIREGFRRVEGTFKEIRHMKTILLFLVAYWCYIDGVDTIIRMAVDYGMSIGFDSSDLIIALLLVQFIGFPAALVFGKLGQHWDTKKSIYLAIAIYVFITLWGMMMERKEEFYILAIMIGLVQGGIQALSRSYYSRLIPKNRTAEFYGFYNMLGKFAAILGPLFIGMTGLFARRLLLPDSPTPTEIFHVGQLAARWGMSSILILFIAGAVIFSFVDEEKGKEEAAQLK
ncbi:MAG: MFS transporter [Deltaproteobacteria bacterium]|nr:MFS transporter [Deltaproteobacteria bacterium]